MPALVIAALQPAIATQRFIRLALKHRPQKTNQIVFLAVAKFAQVGKFLHCAELSLIRCRGVSSYKLH
jgi:hypothetical protein